MDGLNVLVLHNLGRPELSPAFLLNHVFALQRNFPVHRYLYHDAALPLPAYVAEVEFDAIILDVSFLCARWAGDEFFENRKRAYSFVRDSSAVKLAFPQDEYDCHILLDEWMCDWKVDVVFSVISSGWDVLYPKYHEFGDIRLGYTGYVDESLLDRWRKPFAQRRIDIGYRARKLPPYFGRVGENKWTIGRDVAIAAAKFGIKADIALGDAGTLLGEDWLEFINDSKFTLGASSGSSLLDPRGDIQRDVRAFARKHPDASFGEVEAHCFPGMDGKHMFTAISPRVLEAALLDSCQILVDGDYSGIVKPWEHFIPLRSDASNFDEVHSAMRDPELVSRMILQCREAVLSVDDLRYKNKATKILDLIGDLKTRKNVVSSPAAIDNVLGRYRDEMDEKYRTLWRRQRLRRKLVSSLEGYPWLLDVLRKTKRLVT